MNLTRAERLKQYHRTPRGYLTFQFRNMRNRVTGKTGRPQYTGLPIADRDEFINWAMGNAEFHKLFAAWLKAGCPRRLAPSIDRIDPNKGYTLDNVRYLPLNENRRRYEAKVA